MSRGSVHRAPAGAGLDPGFALFLLGFVYYGLRAAEGPAWLDGSELVATSHLLAVPHPTGAPIYLVLAKLAGLVPIGPPAVRVAWLSALFAALAVERLHAVTTWLCARCGSFPRGFGRLPPLLAAALFAFTPGLLAIGHRAELYSLTLWLLLAALRLALAVRESGDARDARLGGLVLGLAAATHPYLTALAIPGLLLVAGRTLVRPRVLLATIGFVLVGGASYGLLALRGRAGGLVGWGDASTLAGFYDILSGRAFQKGFSAPLTGSASESLALFAAGQLGILGAVVIPVAAALGLTRVARRVPVLALGLAALGALGLGSRAAWPFDHATPDTAGYFALPVALVCALAGVLVARLGSAVLPTGAAPVLALAATAAVALGIGVPRGRDLEGYAGRELGLRTLAPLEPGALVVLDDFNLLFMTWYLQAVEGVRPDVTVLFGGFLAQPWYRQRLEAHAPAAARRIDRLADAGAGPLYVDWGLGARRLPSEVRATLSPAGLLLRAGETPGRARDGGAWLLGRDDLDPQTRRALMWFHFRQACFHFERAAADDAAAVQWHDRRIEVLHPGVGLGAALSRGQAAICRGG